MIHTAQRDSGLVHRNVRIIKINKITGDNNWQIKLNHQTSDF